MYSKLGCIYHPEMRTQWHVAQNYTVRGVNVREITLGNTGRRHSCGQRALCGFYTMNSQGWDPHRSGTWGVKDEEATWGANQILGSQHRERWRGPGWLNFRARPFFQGFPRPWSSNWSAAFGTGSRNSNREGGAGLPWRAFCLAILWLKIIFVYLVCLTCVL